MLVHDLQFTVASSDPAALAESIATEGILSDALGNYTISLDGGTPESLHRPPAQRRAGGLRPGAAWPAAPASSPAMFYSHPVRRRGRAWTCPGNRRRPPRKVKQPRATTATRIPGIDRRSGWPEGESPTGRPRVRSGRDFRPYVRSRREGKLGVHRDSHVQRVLVHAPAVALAARCRTGMGNGTGAS